MQLTPEETVLLLTCRPRLRDEERAIIRRLAAQPVDWAYVLWRAEFYRTTPLLFHHLTAADAIGALPLPARAYLESWAAMSRARTTVLFDELGFVIDHLQRAGIEFFLLKGCALASLLYPDPLLRPMLDLDIMVHPADLESARRLLFSLRYVHGVWDYRTNRISRVDYGETDEAEHHELPILVRTRESTVGVPPSMVPRNWRRKHIKCYMRGDGRVSFPVFVDLHFNLSVGFEIADVWRGARLELVQGRLVRVQSLTGMLWFLAARLYHEAFQYATLKLIMFGDVHAILQQRGATIDWAELLAMAERYAMRPALFYVLSQVSRLTDATVPDIVLEQLRPSPREIPNTHDWGDVIPKLFSRAELQDVVLA